MTAIKISPLADILSFGSRITGINQHNVKDLEVRKQIHDQFLSRGVLVFEEMEPSNGLMLELSDIFGPLQEQAMKRISHVDQSLMPGVIDLNYKANVFEIDGKTLSGYVPWHFDACYVAHLTRGGVMRAIDIPAEGGLTGFADGIQLYNAISPQLRIKFANKEILYHPKRMFMNQRFDMPKQYRVISMQPNSITLLEQADNQPRSVHPAVWTRRSGERVLHVCPWQADGIVGEECPEGDAALEELFQEIKAKMVPYWHQWKMTDMVAWDNWRCLHAVSGHDPKYPRRMRRTTIKGDYGLGRFEDDAKGAPNSKSDLTRIDVSFTRPAPRSRPPCEP